MKLLQKSHKLDNVCYDIRGKIHQEAVRMEEEGQRILKLNIGNTATFGFEAPEEVVRDVIRNLPNSQGYSESIGIFSARKAIAQYYQQKGLKNVDADDIFIGNGASELITMSMNALLTMVMRYLYLLLIILCGLQLSILPVVRLFIIFLMNCQSGTLTLWI